MHVVASIGTEIETPGPFESFEHAEDWLRELASASDNNWWAVREHAILLVHPPKDGREELK